MGEFADAVQDYLRAALAERQPAFDWDTEYRIGGTPVDLAGRADGMLVLVELEWRRADPADNTAKLFRHLDAGELTAYDRVFVVQVFSAYYDLASGGVSSKRENAEFVGRVADRAFEQVSYSPTDFDLDPPKRGGDWPTDWQTLADEVADRIAELR